MSHVKIRPATQRDAGIVAAIHVQTWREAYEGILPQEDLDKLSVDKRKAMWREAIEFSEPQVLVAMDDDRMVGFVAYDRSRDPKSRATMGEIWAMYVLPGDWDTGVGLALWDAANDGLLEEGCTNVTLWVMLRNERALRFFDLAGFKRELNTARTTPLGSVKVEEIRLKRGLS